MKCVPTWGWKERSSTDTETRRNKTDILAESALRIRCPMYAENAANR